MKMAFLLTAIITSFILISCNSGSQTVEVKKTVSSNAVIQLSDEGFKKMIFNYEVNKDWKYEGDKPAIIDFYADWCYPCRQLSPLVEEIAKEYEGKIVVYKVDTEKEKVLSQNLGITGLPTLLFVPVKGEPQMAVGLLPKETLVKAINEVLLIR